MSFGQELECLTRQLVAACVDIDSWATFHKAMIKQYANFSLDILVRESVSAHKQGR